MDSFKVINLGEYSKSGASICSCVLDLLDIFDWGDVGHQDVVKFFLQSDANNVVLVLSLENGKLRKSVSWDKDRSRVCQCAWVFELDLDLILFCLQNDSVKCAIFEANIITRSDSSWQVWVVDLNAIFGWCSRNIVVRSNARCLSHLEFDSLFWLCSLACSDLSSPQVQDHCTGLEWAQLACLEELANHPWIVLIAIKS